MVVTTTVHFLKICCQSSASYMIIVSQFVYRFYQSCVYYIFLLDLTIFYRFYQSCVYYIFSLDLTLTIRYFTSFLRKTLVLGIIFSLSLLYCIISFMSMPGNVARNEIDILPARKLDDSFLWHSNDENNETVTVTTCRNSVQGRFLIVDDKGYVCNRLDEILANGCCNASLPHVAEKRYSCETCKENGCCSIYEYCISCCLHPDKKDLLQNVLGKAPDTFRVLFASVTDHFELCLAKCRTSSQSVQHENSYKDPRAKHCYGDSPPSTDSAAE